MTKGCQNEDKMSCARRKYLVEVQRRCGKPTEDFIGVALASEEVFKWKVSSGKSYLRIKCKEIKLENISEKE